MTGSIVTEYAAKQARAVAARTEKELLGAWRTGHDFLYVVTDRNNPNRMLFHPSDYPKFPHGPDVIVERYDLRGVTAEQVREQDTPPTE